MDYKLVKLNAMTKVSELADNDYVLADIVDSGPDGYKTAAVRVVDAFATNNIRLSDAGSIQIDISDPIFDGANFPDSVESQTDANKLFTECINNIVDKVNQLPNVILHNGPDGPVATDVFSNVTLHANGTLWIDTSNFRVYVFVRERDDNGAEFGYWVSLTDR